VGLGGNGVTVVLAGSSTSQTVKAGATATYALQLTAVGGAPTNTFSVTFACSGAPSKATCTVPTSAVDGHSGRTDRGHRHGFHDRSQHPGTVL
jgi:hypothetical protein